MKILNLALLGTAALVAASITARADDLATLKAQMDAISPVADAPIAAPTASIAWSGYVRAAIETTYDTTRAAGNQYATDIVTRAKLKVVGKTDTAVGQVGVEIQMRAVDNDNSFATNVGNGVLQTDGYYGWWKLTPNLTLSAGIANPIKKGTLASNTFSFDFNCACYYADDPWGAIVNAPQVKTPLENSSKANPAQIGLTYADGPLTVAMAVEDSNNSGNNSAIGGSAKALYKTDSFGVDLSGGYWGNAAAAGVASWGVSAGAGVNFAPFKLGASVGVGNSGNFLVPAFDYTVATAYALVNIGDSAALEVGAVHDFGTAGSDVRAGATEYMAGIYYNPVKQLTLGAEGSFQSGGKADQSYTAALVTVFRF